MSQPVTRNQRWSRANPCPICGGTPPQCNGYAGEKEGVIFCTDTSLSGGLDRGDQGQYKHWMKAPCDCGVTHGFTPNLNFTEKKKPMSEVTKRLEATFDYGDGCYVDRIWTSIIATNGKNKKEFVQYRMGPDGKKDFTGFKKLYPAQEKRRWGNSLIFVEGEKQVDALKGEGFEAFCFPGGSGGWSAEAAEIYCEMLRGKFIFIWPDNDESGAKLAEKMSNSFKAKGIKHVIVNKLTAGLPTNGGDVIDWLKIPGNDSDRLEKILIEHSPPKRFYKISEYGLIPPVEWLFEPMFIERGLSLTVGESEVGKSFVTLFYACQIARLTGRPVIYLGLESFSQYPERVLALIQHYKWELGDNFILSNYPLQLLDKASVEGFIRDVQEQNINPAMVVIDTYHAATEGADEISGQDTGLIIGSLKMIRDLLETNVNCIHHLNAAGSRERGHTSLKAAMDTMIVLKTDGDGVAVECGKQRTAKHFDTRTINWAYLEDGNRVVVESQQAAKVDFTRLGKNDEKLLRVLGAELHRAKGLRYAQILSLTGIAQSSLTNALAKCRKAGWVQGGDDTPNIITNDGLEMIGYSAGEINEY
jgi:5S rRNA maturation endonuclease (ribonuclease M5)